MIIDDMRAPSPLAANGSTWQLFSDRVMGGVSHGTMKRERVFGRDALRVQGNVSLENNGGFLQIALDLVPGGGALDAGAFAGLEIDVTGNGESYGCHLRTTETSRPWQSYRRSFIAGPAWARIRLPFAEFAAHRIDASFDAGKLRRIGLVAIGRAFEADLAVSRVAFYREIG